jgi:hypothetical protein
MNHIPNITARGCFMGDGHFSAAEKNWSGHFRGDIIGQISAVYL